MSSANPPDDRQAPVSLADEEAVKQVLIDSVLGLWDTVNNLTRITPSRRDRYRVTIFGSARAKPGSLMPVQTRRRAQVVPTIWEPRHALSVPWSTIGA